MRSEPKSAARGYAGDGARGNRRKRQHETEQDVLPKMNGSETAAEKLERSRQLNLAAQARYRRKLAVGSVPGILRFLAAQVQHGCTLQTPIFNILQAWVRVCENDLAAPCPLLCIGVALSAIVHRRRTIRSASKRVQISI